MSRSQRTARRGAGPVFEAASLGPGHCTPLCPAVEEARSPPEFPSCYPSFRMFAEARTPFLSPRSTLQFPGEILNDSAKAGVGEALALSTVSELQSPGHHAENPTAWHTCPGRRGCPRRAIGSSFPRPRTAASARGQVRQRAGRSTSCPGRRHHPLVTRVARVSLLLHLRTSLLMTAPSFRGSLRSPRPPSTWPRPLLCPGCELSEPERRTSVPPRPSLRFCLSRHRREDRCSARS